MTSREEISTNIDYHCFHVSSFRRSLLLGSLAGTKWGITKFLTNALHLPAIDIYGFKGIVLVFTLQLFPLVFLYVAGTMNSIDNSLLEAAESMGSFGFKPIVTVVLPLLVPTLLAAPCLYL